MEISKLIAENIVKHNGIFTFASLAGDDEHLLDYLIEDICSYINKPVLSNFSFDELYSDSVYILDYNSTFIKENYRKISTDARIFTSNLLDISGKKNISFIVTTHLVTNSGLLGSIATANSLLVYASSYVATVNGGMFKNQKNRYDMDGLYLNLKAIVREDRMKKVLN
jgi:hypothetical protein